MKDKSKSGTDSTKSKKPPVSTARKKLFGPIPGSTPAPTESRQIALEYLVEADPDLSLKWHVLEKQFAGLTKLDPANISGLEYDPTTADKKGLEEAEMFFSQLTERLTVGFVTGPGQASIFIPASRAHAKQTEFVSNRMCELMLKVFIVVYQHIVFQLFFRNITERGDAATHLGTVVVEAPAPILAAETLEKYLARARMPCNFAMFLLECHNMSTISKYADSLIVIIENLMNKVQKTIVNGADIKDQKILARAFYYQFEILAVLATCSDERALGASGAKMRAKRLLEAYNVFERLLSPFYASEEVRPLANICVARDEQWMAQEPGTLLAVQNGRVKFRLTNFFAAATPTFTLGYVLVFYLYRLGQAVLSSDTRVHEQMVSAIYSIMKHNTTLLAEPSKLDKPVLASILNTNLVILKLVKRLLETVENPADFAERLLGESLKNCALSHLQAALSQGVIMCDSLCPPKTTYCETNHDAVSVIFKTLLKLKGVQHRDPKTRIAIQPEVFPLFPVADAIVLAFLNVVQQCKGLSPVQLSFIKAYMVEYLASDLSHPHQGQHRSPLFASIFAYALPPVGKTEDPVKIYANELLTASIISAVRTDRHWALAAFTQVFKQVQDVQTMNEPFLTSAFRLLYSVLTGRPCSEAVLLNSSSVSAHAPIDLNPNAVQAFAELHGMRIILDKLMATCAGPAEVIHVMEMGILLLHNIPVLCESVLLNVRVATGLLESAVASGRHLFVVSLFRKCLLAVRNNEARAMGEEQHKENYLPIVLVKFVAQGLLSKADGQRELALQLYDVITEFLAHEPNFPLMLETHQKALYFSMEWRTLLDLVAAQGYDTFTKHDNVGLQTCAGRSSRSFSASCGI